MFASLAIRFIENASSRFSFSELTIVPTPLGIAISLKLVISGSALVLAVRGMKMRFHSYKQWGMSRPMTIVAMCMKKSRQVWTDVWDGCTSSMGADFSCGLGKVVEAGRADGGAGSSERAGTASG
jgi:hypothetical protein